MMVLIVGIREGGEAGPAAAAGIQMTSGCISLHFTALRENTSNRQTDRQAGRQISFPHVSLSVGEEEGAVSSI